MKKLLTFGVTGLFAAAVLGRIGALQALFSDNYIPHRFCYLAQPGLVWTNVSMDGLIAISYVAIFSGLFWIVGKLRDLPGIREFLWTFVGFGAFVLACGATHFMDVVTVWLPVYPLSAAFKVLCATVSASTAVYFTRMAPHLVADIRGFVEVASQTQRQKERELRDNAIRIKAVVDSAIDGLITIDERGKVESFNPACERIFGYTSGEVIGQNIKMLMPEPYHGEHDVYLSHYMATGEARIIGTSGRQVSGKRKDGSVFPMDLSVSAFQLENGRYFSGIIRDITGQRKIAHELEETAGRLRLLVEGVRDHALFTVDLTGCVTSWNRGAERLLGYSESFMLNRNFSCLFTSEDIQAGVPEIQMNKARQEGHAQDEGWRIRANGERFSADVTKTALAEEDGQVRGFAILMRDVSERKKTEAAMEEAQQERLRLQEKFLSHVSHELRTPLTAIYFFTTNVLDGLFGDLTPDQHEQLSLALDNAKQLKDMVSDLLDITRVESHKLSVASQPANSVRLIGEVLNTCRTHAAARNIRLHSAAAPDLPFVWADPARVRQILINLVDNGIKFTPEDGTIVVDARVSPEDSGFVRLSVTDTGCGISPENRETIFDRLSQVKSNTEASRSGLGLGLFITKELVSRHGGRIWVESVLGEGSTFYFTLPIFSLSEWCARVLIAPNLETGSVTLIAVDIVSLNGAIPTDSIHEIKRALERCIQPGQDVILPSITHPANPENGQIETIFIVACTGPAGFAVIESRIRRELQNTINISRFRPIISSTTVPVTAGTYRERQIDEITAGIERRVQEHLSGKEKVN